MMLIATFNVENMFDRAKAMNGATWAEGKPALEAHKTLNALFENALYRSADKTRMLALLEANGLLKSDDGPMMRLRKIRGELLKRQARRVREIYDTHITAGDNLVMVMGDLNEIPGNDPLTPPLREGSTLRDVASHPKYDDGGRPGTRGDCNAAGKFDSDSMHQWKR